MTDPNPSAPRAKAAISSDDETRIEQLLVTGLDYYFAGDFENAVNLWTRVLFLDRHHDRARAYIERARSAQAEGQRVSEGLVHQGLEAFDRGEVARARALLSDALHKGASHDLALGVLGRIDRLDVGQGRTAIAPEPARRRLSRRRTATDNATTDRGLSAGVWAGLVLVVMAIGAVALYFDAPMSFESVWPAPPAAERPLAAAASPEPLLVPDPGETYVAQARQHFAAGRLRDALRELDRLPLGAALLPEAERLRGEIQRELLTIAGAVPAAPPGPATLPSPPPE